MAREWERQFAQWSVGPGKTEQDKMDRAERAIREAIRSSAKLGAHDVIVFPQGSYRNRTTVAGESDVDICVMCRDVFFTDWELVDLRARVDPSVRKELDRTAGYVDVAYNYAQFKNDVGEALVAKFGPPPAVKRGDKAYDIHENTYRVESDCLPAMQLRMRSGSRTRSWETLGIEFVSDSGKRIQNFPEQQYNNGVAKHDRTGRRFKKVVRIIKNLRNEMNSAGVAAAAPISSFLGECLVWNVPDDRFDRASFYAEVRETLRYLYHGTATADACSSWKEENGIKFLFHASQPWTREQVNAFVLSAWGYVGYGSS